MFPKLRFFKNVNNSESQTDESTPVKVLLEKLKEELKKVFSEKYNKIEEKNKHFENDMQNFFDSLQRELDYNYTTQINTIFAKYSEMLNQNKLYFENLCADNNQLRVTHLRMVITNKDYLLQQSQRNFYYIKQLDTIFAIGLTRQNSLGEVLGIQHEELYQEVLKHTEQYYLRYFIGKLKEFIEDSLFSEISGDIRNILNKCEKLTGNFKSWQEGVAQNFLGCINKILEEFSFENSIIQTADNYNFTSAIILQIALAKGFFGVVKKIFEQYFNNGKTVDLNEIKALETFNNINILKACSDVFFKFTELCKIAINSLKEKQISEKNYMPILCVAALFSAYEALCQALKFYLVFNTADYEIDFEEDFEPLKDSLNKVCNKFNLIKKHADNATKDDVLMAIIQSIFVIFTMNYNDLLEVVYGSFFGQWGDEEHEKWYENYYPFRIIRYSNLLTTKTPAMESILLQCYQWSESLLTMQIKDITTDIEDCKKRKAEPEKSPLKSSSIISVPLLTSLDQEVRNFSWEKSLIQDENWHFNSAITGLIDQTTQFFESVQILFSKHISNEGIVMDGINSQIDDLCMLTSYYEIFQKINELCRITITLLKAKQIPEKDYVSILNVDALFSAYEALSRTLNLFLVFQNPIDDDTDCDIYYQPLKNCLSELMHKFFSINNKIDAKAKETILIAMIQAIFVMCKILVVEKQDYHIELLFGCWGDETDKNGDEDEAAYLFRIIRYAELLRDKTAGIKQILLYCYTNLKQHLHLVNNVEALVKRINNDIKNTQGMKRTLPPPENTNEPNKARKDNQGNRQPQGPLVIGKEKDEDEDNDDDFMKGAPTQNMFY